MILNNDRITGALTDDIERYIKTLLDNGWTIEYVIDNLEAVIKHKKIDYNLD